MRLVSAFLVCALVSGMPASVLAQSEPAAIKPIYQRPVMDSVVDSIAVPAAEAAPASSCWRAQPPPVCPGFFLTELGMEIPVLSTQVADRSAGGGTRGPGSDIRARAVWTFGFMGTKGMSSHGGTVSITSEDTPDSRIPFALEYRYRRWLRGISALDLGLGYRAMSVWKDGTGFRDGRGVTAMTGYTFNAYVGVSLRGDLVRGAGRTRGGLQVGVRSTRLSEVVLKLTAIAAVRAALAAIGMEDDEEDDEDQGGTA